MHEKGINACYERSKSCLENGDDCYQKQLYGWYGGIQRQLQRSQYYVQYSRPTQIIFWILVLIFIFGEFAFSYSKNIFNFNLPTFILSITTFYSMNLFKC